jgi:hypothetical protein
MKSYELQLTPVDIKHFHWDSISRNLTAFASDLGHGVEGLTIVQRLYNDACDVGIAILNPATGTTVRFCLEGRSTDRELEITAWNFSVVESDRHLVGGCHGVTIFND